MSAMTARPRLAVLNGEYKGRDFILYGAVSTIGRNPECEVQIDLASVSRRHARIEERPEGFYVSDLGSRNGIKLGNVPVQETLLRHGDVVSVGDVMLRFEAPAPEAAPAPAPPAKAAPTAPAPPAKAAPAQGRAASELFLPPRTVIGLNMKLVAAVIGALVVAAVIGIVMVKYVSRPQAVRLEYPAVIVKAGEKKWMRAIGLFPDMIRVNGTLRPQTVIPAISDELDVGDPAVAEAEWFDTGELVIGGKSNGETTVFLKTAKGVPATIRVLVRGVLEDPLDELRFGAFTPDQRRARAEQYVKDGVAIEAEQPYRAMQEYEDAMAVLENVPRGEVYFSAESLHKKAAEAVERRWEKLKSDIRLAAGNNDRVRQMELLKEVEKLAPDPNDPRNQKARERSRQLIREELAEKESRGI